MKKLICAAAMSALCATVFAIESENIVGYQQIPIDNGAYQLFTVTFKDVAGAKYDLQNVRVVVKSTGAEFATNNRVKIQKVETESSGAYGTIYNWRVTNSGTGWHQGSTYVDTLKLEKGEALLVNSGANVELVFQVSGEVDLTPVSYSIPNSSYQILGNMTPVEIDIQDITPYAGDAVVSQNNRVKLQLIENPSSGAYGTIYNWRTTNAGTGWHQGSTYIGRDAITLQPGEGFLINNGYASPITLKFKSPL